MMLDSRERRRGSRVSSTWPTPVCSCPWILAAISTKNHSPWRWSSRHAIGPLENGHLPRYIRDRVGWHNRGFWFIPPDSMRAVYRSRPCIIRDAVSDDLPEPLYPVRCRDRDQVLRCGSQLPDHHWRFDAGSGQRLRARRCTHGVLVR